MGKNLGKQQSRHPAFTPHSTGALEMLTTPRHSNAQDEDDPPFLKKMLGAKDLLKNLLDKANEDFPSVREPAWAENDRGSRGQYKG
ncbi:hypothetical protein TNIN_280801 [Trichonephila inaurata madagascariensis]|uniref:Uncharacterized protein n=1 Tax=Trichonephila inaurata madagascariensis TaxID=2747483 RepID=A0A8X6MG70_9ARAC|nr:hypothetical protein TNIN_280801 [Trichonephila inaurata madagascariensis]